MSHYHIYVTMLLIIIIRPWERQLHVLAPQTQHLCRMTFCGVLSIFTPKSYSHTIGLISQLATHGLYDILLVAPTVGCLSIVSPVAPGQGQVTSFLPGRQDPVLPIIMTEERL